MDKIDIDVKIDTMITSSISIDDVIKSLNQIQMNKRWSYISKIILGVQGNLSGLTDEEKIILKKYLTDKLAYFNLNA